MNKIQSLLVIFAFVSLSSFGQSKKWTLEECVNYALQNNISIKQSTFDSELTDITRKDAIGRFLPSANANASHSWNIGLNQNITTGLLENQTTQFTSAGLNVGVDIYKGMQNQNQLRKANLSKIAAQYQLTKMQEDVSLNVVNAYLQILFNKENLKVQKEQLVLDTKQMERTTELVEAGVVAKGDLLDVKATLATDNQRLINAENTLLLSKLSLGQLLQLADFKDFDIADEDIVVKDSPVLLEEPNAILKKAKETRTELKLAQTNLQLAEKDIQIAKGAYQPTLQGFYGFNTRASNSDRILFNSSGQVIGISGPNALFNQFSDNKGQNFGAQLTIPIFNGFATRNNVSRSKVALEKSKLALNQQELDLERTVYTAFTDTKGAQKTHESATATLEARQNAMEYAKERYEVGLMNIFDYNQTQTMFVNAQSEVLRTKYDYIFRTKILEFYFGIPIINNK
ncbi:TolC family protein [Flavobacterium amnicola]|uniref:TolC family protein n=1 Tax=Flavobacterium amnicola TaxID=2506422 RepID=A0A4Q1K4G8_9FLAO|nr:TolC family protein [Flavobacterium amnicola]RXR20618.1 TolC family protein [Flavobacterium amnicola]